MTQSRHENGLNNIEQLYGELGANGLTQNAQLAPKFDEYICDFAYGDIYSRKSLSSPFLR